MEGGPLGVYRVNLEIIAHVARGPSADIRFPARPMCILGTTYSLDQPERFSRVYSTVHTE
jgi:hypothetical protein